MDAVELLAIFILAGAVVVLLYYYLQNNADVTHKIRTYMPAGVQNHGEEEKVPDGAFNMSSNANEDSSNTSMGEKIKVRFKDIDMPNINTDVFSKRIDAFLDEKSEDLIKGWELATKEDINALEERCDVAYRNVDEITKRFNEYREYTNERLDSIDKRLKKLEEENSD